MYHNCTSFTVDVFYWLKLYVRALKKKLGPRIPPTAIIALTQKAAELLTNASWLVDFIL